MLTLNAAAGRSLISWCRMQKSHLGSRFVGSSNSVSQLLFLEGGMMQSTLLHKMWSGASVTFCLERMEDLPRQLFSHGNYRYTACV